MAPLKTVKIVNIEKKQTQQVTCGSVTLVNADIRRSISEYNDARLDYSIQLFTVHQPIPLGNHYHTKKFEVFVILEGEGMLTSCAVDTQGNRIGRRATKTITAPFTIRIEPYTAHAFILHPGSKMLCYSSKSYDHSDLVAFRLI